jgi:hypothetical protein
MQNYAQQDVVSYDDCTIQGAEHLLPVHPR